MTSPVAVCWKKTPPMLATFIRDSPRPISRSGNSDFPCAVSSGVKPNVKPSAMRYTGASALDGGRVYPPEAYRAVFAILALEISLALLLYRAAPDFLSKKTA